MSNDQEYPDLTTELHARTKDSHDESNKLVNIKVLVALTDPVLYGSVLKDFFFVFQAIEDGLEMLRDNEYIFPLRNRLWYRQEEFDKDVAYFLGSDWKSHHQPSKAVKRYQERISEVIRDDPLLMIAYASTMHVAMFAGGQILRPLVKKTLGLKEENGMAIFNYTTDSKTVRTELKNTLNNLKLDKQTVDKIVVEKKLIFKMNNSIAANVSVSYGAMQRLLKWFLLVVLAIIAIIMFIKAIY